MGVDFYCGDTTFGCSYGSWNAIRIQIIKATIDYIYDKCEKDKELYGNLSDNDENYIGEGSTYHSYMKRLMELRTIVFEKPSPNVFGKNIDNTLCVFNTWCHKFHNMNALNKFDIGGLYALCNQSDCEGYYTIGNALDICLLLSKIQPFAKKYESYDCIYTLDDSFQNNLCHLFEHSYRTMIKVNIC